MATKSEYGNVCVTCGQRVTSKDQAQFYFDHRTKTGWARHLHCPNNEGEKE